LLESQSVSGGGVSVFELCWWLEPCVCFVGAAVQPIAGKPAPTPVVVASGDLKQQDVGWAKGGVRGEGKQKRPTFR